MTGPAVPLADCCLPGDVCDCTQQATEIAVVLASAALGRATSELTPVQRRVLALRIGGGLSVEHIAAVMRRPAAEVAAEQLAALQVLGQVLADFFPSLLAERH